jgi:uncharacterized protein (TIGR03083 family)
MSDAKKEEIREKLNQARIALFDCLQGLEATEWQTAVQSEDARWTVADLVRHLINAEKGMTGLIVQFQQGNDPVPPDFDRERYNVRSVEKIQHLTPAAMLETMTANRNQLLQVIATLAPDDWQKRGRHASLRIMSIEEICHLIADHETAHLADIQKALVLRP